MTSLKSNNLPNFLVIGAMKCGTTSLCYYLSQHPEIFIPQTKDLYFFSNDNIYEKGLNWYKTHFIEGAKFKLVGEGTDNYSKAWEFPNAAKRIKTHLPDAKLIYITRNPLKQIESAWGHMRVMNNEKLSFDKAIFSKPFYIDNCRYLKQLNRYKALFPQENIHVLFLEDIIKQTDSELKKLFQFLQVNSNYKITKENAQNTRLKRYGDRNINKILKKIPLYSNISNLLPNDLKTKIKPLVKWRMKNKPILSNRSQKKFIQTINAETIAFLKEYKKPETFWDTSDCKWS